MSESNVLQLNNLSYRTIPLTQGYVAIVDADDYETINRYNWCASVVNGHIYATRAAERDGKKTTVLMHRQIAQAPKGVEVDHWDGNGLNNRRSNLRNCAHHENLSNAKLYANNTSGFKGVSWKRNRHKWAVQIGHKNAIIHLGYFTDKLAAANAYNIAATRLFGRFVRLNILKEGKGQSEMCAGKAHKIEYPKNSGGGSTTSEPSPTTEARR